MILPLTRWERRKFPKPTLRSSLNMASAEALSNMPRLRGLLERLAFAVNKWSVDVAGHLQVATMFENMKGDAHAALAQRKIKATPDRVAEEVDAMLAEPAPSIVTPAQLPVEYAHLH